MLAGCYLQEDGEDDQGSDAVHDAAVVRHQGLPTASRPDVELLDAVVVVVVGRVVGQVVLEAGPWRAGVTAAEGDAVHQVAAVNVAPDTTGRNRGAARGRVRAGGRGTLKNSGSDPETGDKRQFYVLYSILYIVQTHTVKVYYLCT